MNTENYQQIQMLEYQIKQLQKVMESIDSQLAEMSSTIDALRDFETLSSNEEVLFPVANGIFAKGKLSDNHILRINIGSNVVVEKSISETIAMMHSQAKDIENYKSEVVLQFQKLVDAMNGLQGIN
jgi:prefoldin alpha subunit